VRKVFLTARPSAAVRAGRALLDRAAALSARSPRAAIWQAATNTSMTTSHTTTTTTPIAPSSIAYGLAYVEYVDMIICGPLRAGSCRPFGATSALGDGFSRPPFI
jgi:hypothetical protein